MAIQAISERSKKLDRRGFVLPVVIFGLVTLSVLAVVAMMTADDEFRSAHAVRESAAAFYAADGGLAQLITEFDEETAIALASGDSLVFDWRAIGPHRYRGVVQRVDNNTDGPDRIFEIRVEGESRAGGHAFISATVTTMPTIHKGLGFCCDAALTVRGTSDVYPENSPAANLVSGFNNSPPEWGDVCGPGEDRPAIVTEDTTTVRVDGNSVVENGMLETEIPADAFDQFGDFMWEEIKAMADHVVDATTYPDSHWENDGLIHPYYNADGTCDTSTPLNWGSNDPNDPCFNYFPVILIRGEVDIHNAYGQAVVILDYNEAAHVGSEFDIENGAEFNGIVLGRGCLEIEDGALFRGAAFVDGTWDYDWGTSGCGNDADLDVNDGATTRYSQCAIDRALELSVLNMAAEDSITGYRSVAVSWRQSL